MQSETIRPTPSRTEWRTFDHARQLQLMYSKITPALENQSVHYRWIFIGTVPCRYSKTITLIFNKTMIFTCVMWFKSRLHNRGFDIERSFTFEVPTHNMHFARICRITWIINEFSMFVCCQDIAYICNRKNFNITWRWVVVHWNISRLEGRLAISLRLLRLISHWGVMRCVTSWKSCILRPGGRGVEI